VCTHDTSGLQARVCTRLGERRRGRERVRGCQTRRPTTARERARERACVYETGTVTNELERLVEIGQVSGYARESSHTQRSTNERMNGALCLTSRTPRNARATCHPDQPGASILSKLIRSFVSHCLCVGACHRRRIIESSPGLGGIEVVLLLGAPRCCSRNIRPMYSLLKMRSSRPSCC